jgi:hypothetical protein
VQPEQKDGGVVAAYAAALDLSVAGVVYDRGVDRLLQALAPHSGALVVERADVELAFDVEATDVGSAAHQAEGVARRVVTGRHLTCPAGPRRVDATGSHSFSGGLYQALHVCSWGL